MFEMNQKSQLPKSEGASFRPYRVTTGDFKEKTESQR